MIWLLGTAFLSLGLVNLDFSRGWWRGQLRRLAVGVPLAGAFCYSRCRRWCSRRRSSLLLITLVPNVLITSVTAARTMVISRRVVSLRRTPVWPLAIAVGASALFTLVLWIAPVVDASGLRDLVGATTSTSGAPAADPRHVRVVPEESAIFAGEKVVGQLGAYYRVGTYNVQSENGRLVWVAPLNFQGAVQWLSRRTLARRRHRGCGEPRQGRGAARARAAGVRAVRAAQRELAPPRVAALRHRAAARRDAADRRRRATRAIS